MLGLRELGDDAVGQLQKIAERFELFVKGDGVAALQTLGARAAISQNSQCWPQFAPAPFPNNNAKHSPDILFSFKELFALSFSNDAPNESPAHEIAKIAVRIAATDFELRHDVIGAERSGRSNKKGMDLRHGSVDPPGAADRAPLADEFVSRIRKSGIWIVFVIHVFSINLESSVCQISFEQSVILKRAPDQGAIEEQFCRPTKEPSLSRRQLRLP